MGGDGECHLPYNCARFGQGSFGNRSLARNLSIINLGDVNGPAIKKERSKKMKRLKQAGFTVIELTLIGSILAALLAVALPAVQ